MNTSVSYYIRKWGCFSVSCVCAYHWIFQKAGEISGYREQILCSSVKNEHRCPSVSVMSPMVLGVWVISWAPFTEQVVRNQSPDPTKGSACPEQCQSLVDPFLPKCLEKQPVAHVRWDLVGWPRWRCQTLFSTCRDYPSRSSRTTPSPPSPKRVGECQSHLLLLSQENRLRGHSAHLFCWNTMASSYFVFSHL